MIVEKQALLLQSGERQPLIRGTCPMAVTVELPSQFHDDVSFVGFVTVQG